MLRLSNIILFLSYCPIVTSSSEKIGLVTENEATERRRKLGEDSNREESRKDAFEVAGLSKVRDKRSQFQKIKYIYLLHFHHSAFDKFYSKSLAEVGIS